MTREQTLMFYCPFCRSTTLHKKEGKYWDGTGTIYRCSRCESYVEQGPKYDTVEVSLRNAKKGITDNLKFRYGLLYEDAKDMTVPEILEILEEVDTW